MSDLVGNPEDRFSRVAAHIEGKDIWHYVVILESGNPKNLSDFG